MNRYENKMNEINIIYNIDNKKYEICEYYKFGKKKENLNVKLIETKRINNMSYMFNLCQSLLSFPDISKWNTNNVTNMSNIFRGCESLLSLPDISKWNINNVTNMSNMFFECKSLYISKWNTNNVNNKSDMFYGCKKTLNYPQFH